MMLTEQLNKVFFITIFFVFSFSSCDENVLYANQNKSVTWGMNAHLTFSCSEKHMDELCRSMANAGVSIVRLDLYWSPENMLAQRKEFDRAAYYVTKYGMDILLNIPQTPISLGDKGIDKWCEGISYYVKRYDGSSTIDIGNGDVGRNITIRYFEIMNEPEQWQRTGLTVDSLFIFIKKSTEAIWRARSKNKVFIVMPGICNQEKFNSQLMAYRDEEGKGINDYVDIWNFHYYSDKEKLCWHELQRWRDFFRTKEILAEKQIWMTEYGHSLWDCNEKKQSVLLTKQGLVAATLGIEKIFYYQFHQFGGNYFSTDQREDFFGIIDTSIKNSYGSFLRNDGIYKRALCDGDGTKKIYITPRRDKKFSLYTMTKNICKELKTNGIAIGGKGFTIDKVILKKNNYEKVIYTGNYIFPKRKSSNRILKISSSFFKEIELSDQIIVQVKDILDQTDNWDNVHPLKSYYAYKTLTENCPSGSIVYHIDNELDVNIVAWKVDSIYRYALWSDSVERKIILKKNPINKMINQWGERMVNKNNVIHVNEDVLYLESNNELEFQKHINDER